MTFRHLIVWALLASATACGDPTGIDDDAPFPSGADTVTIKENRGLLVLSGASVDFSGQPDWAFVGNGSAFVAKRWFPDRGVWFVDPDANRSVQLIEGPDVIQQVKWASGAERVYVSEFNRIQSIAVDGSAPLDHTDDTDGRFLVSPNGRLLLHDRFVPAGSTPWSLIDYTRDTVVDMPSNDYLALFDTHLLFLSEDTPGALGVWDLESGVATPVYGLPATVGPYGPIIGAGGSRSNPTLTLLDVNESGVRIQHYRGDTTSGTMSVIEVLEVPRDSVYSSPNGTDEVAAAVSADGTTVAMSVTRERLNLCFGRDTGCPRFHWEIRVADIDSGNTRVVARGASYWPADELVLSPTGDRLLYEVDGDLYLVERIRG